MSQGWSWFPVTYVSVTPTTSPLYTTASGSRKFVENNYHLDNIFLRYFTAILNKSLHKSLHYIRTNVHVCILTTTITIHFKWAQSKVWLGPKWTNLYSLFEFLCGLLIGLSLSYKYESDKENSFTNIQMNKKNKTHNVNRTLTLSTTQTHTHTHKKEEALSITNISTRFPSCLQRKYSAAPTSFNFAVRNGIRCIRGGLNVCWRLMSMYSGIRMRVFKDWGMFLTL